ncbi:MAG TPA: hypothetical protein VGE53_00595 [Candidatus Paceibacterota bacterium]
MHKKATAVGAATVLLLIAAPAVAQESMTLESCKEYLMHDPAGPRIDPESLRIGTIVFGEPVFEGMTVEYLCEREVSNKAVLAQKDEQIATLTGSLETQANKHRVYTEFYLGAQEDSMTGYIRRYPGDIVIIFCMIGFLVTGILYWGLFGKQTARFLGRMFRKRRVHTFRKSIWSRIWSFVLPNRSFLR